jgi:hypothetical protein
MPGIFPVGFVWRKPRMNWWISWNILKKKKGSASFPEHAQSAPFARLQNHPKGDFPNHGATLPNKNLT